MPHSGGGGSHGGGGHSGGSHGGSHSSGGGGSSSPIRSTYYPGSSRYVYYHRGRPHYFYSNRDPRTQKAGVGNMFSSVIFLLIFLFAGLFVGYSGITVPKKLTTAVEKAPVIVDNVGVIDNGAELSESLQAFADKTGVVPLVFTVHNEDWKGKYNDLEAYAYDLYLNSCSDESHVLIVYSEPQEPDAQFNDWYWELMQGDDTDDILNDKVLETFDSTLQAALTRTKGSVGEDIAEAFTAIEPLTMKLHIEWGSLAFSLVWLVVVVFIFIGMLKSGKTAKLQATAQPIALDAQEMTCEYCGSKYIPGTLSNCPNCGAAIVYNASAQPSVNPVQQAAYVPQQSAPSTFNMGEPLNYSAPQPYQQPYQQQPYQQQPYQQQPYQQPPNTPGNPPAGGSTV